MLSTTAEYALHALSTLSRASAGQHVLGRELAQATGIPVNYLSKVLVALGQAGILEAARGPRGGYRLRRDPRTIALAEIVAVFESQRRRDVCVLGGSRHCSDDQPCTAHHRWKRVRLALSDFLENTTLEEISTGVASSAGPAPWAAEPEPPSDKESSR